MKATLLLALFVSLTSTCAQAQPAVFKPRQHIDDGIVAGPGKPVFQWPRVLGKLRPNAREGQMKWGSLPLYTLHERPLTLTESVRNSRASGQSAGVKFVSLKGPVITVRYTFGDGIYVPLYSGFPLGLRPGTSSPYPAFSLKSKETPMSTTRLERLLFLAGKVRVSSRALH